MEWIFAPILQPIILLRTILTQRFNAGRANALYGAARVRVYPTAFRVPWRPPGPPWCEREAISVRGWLHRPTSRVQNLKCRAVAFRRWLWPRFTRLAVTLIDFHGIQQ